MEHRRPAPEHWMRQRSGTFRRRAGTHRRIRYGMRWHMRDLGRNIMFRLEQATRAEVFGWVTVAFWTPAALVSSLMPAVVPEQGYVTAECATACAIGAVICTWSAVARQRRQRPR